MAVPSFGHVNPHADVLVPTPTRGPPPQFRAAAPRLVESNHVCNAEERAEHDRMNNAANVAMLALIGCISVSTCLDLRIPKSVPAHAADIRSRTCVSENMGAAATSRNTAKGEAGAVQVAPLS
jgi:hypothetical protein